VRRGRGGGALQVRPSLLRRGERRAVGFAAVTIVAYVALIPGPVDARGRADTAIEALLLALWVVEDRRVR
jgi:hypothetical protein